jgi:hypothetical protein
MTFSATREKPGKTSFPGQAVAEIFSATRENL